LRLGGERTSTIIGAEAENLALNLWNSYQKDGDVSMETVNEIKKRNGEYFLQNTPHGFFSSIAPVWAWINTFFTQHVEKATGPTNTPQSKRFDTAYSNTGIWSDYLKWPTKVGISERINLPF